MTRSTESGKKWVYPGEHGQNHHRRLRKGAEDRMSLSLPLVMTEYFNSIWPSISASKVTIYQGRSQYVLTSILIDCSPLLAIRMTFRKPVTHGLSKQIKMDRGLHMPAVQCSANIKHGPQILTPHGDRWPVVESAISLQRASYWQDVMLAVTDSGTMVKNRGPSAPLPHKTRR